MSYRATALTTAPAPTYPRGPYFGYAVAGPGGDHDKKEVIQGMVGLYRVNGDDAKVRRMSIASTARRQVREPGTPLLQQGELT